MKYQKITKRILQLTKVKKTLSVKKLLKARMHQKKTLPSTDKTLTRLIKTKVTSTSN